jgi:hypothetical protein
MNTNTAVDWAWVKKELSRVENITSYGKKTGLRRAADACLKTGFRLSGPKSVWSEKRVVSIKENRVNLEGGAGLSSAFLASYLKGARSVGIFVVTIGKALEDEASRLMAEGEGLDGYLLDRIGSLAVESLAENFETSMRRDCRRRHLSLSRRLSPGYCDWPIEEQFALEKLVDFSKAAVRLTESCMMTPKKSISAVAGIGPMGLFTDLKSQCAICDKPECGYRR